jgi:hypothetical protein
MSQSPRHIIKFHSFSSLVIKVNKFIIHPFPRAVSNCYVIEMLYFEGFNSVKYMHACN